MEQIQLFKKGYQKLQGKVNGIYEFSRQSFQRSQANQFMICITTDTMPCLLFGCAQDQSRLQTSEFQFICYQNRKQENELFNLVTSMIEINYDSVICSHYDGSLIVYKKFKERRLKINTEDYISLIEPHSNINKVITNISGFSNKGYILLRLEHYDQSTTQMIIDQQFSVIQRERSGPQSDFNFRKYLRNKEILCGFTCQEQFSIIEKNIQSERLELQNAVKYNYSDQVTQMLQIQKCQLIQFDASYLDSIYYIVCVYRVEETNEQIICGFTLNPRDQSQQRPSLQLQCSYSLKLNYGGVVNLFSIGKDQQQYFKFDVVVVFQHQITAYKLFNFQDSQLEIVIKRNEERQIEYSRYYFQIIEGIPFHLIVSNLTGLKADVLEYVNLKV